VIRDNRNEFKAKWRKNAKKMFQVMLQLHTSNSDISDQELLDLSRREMNKLVKGRSEGDDSRKRLTLTLKRRQPTILDITA
jgi:hypothetical protein